MDSFYDSPTEPWIDACDDTSNRLSMLAQNIQSDCDANVQGQRSNILQSACKLQDKAHKLIIDSGTFTNAKQISSRTRFELTLHMHLT